MDEYGRQPGTPDYKDRERHDRDWSTFQEAKLEWAKKLVDMSLAYVDKYSREDEVGDDMMAKYLRQEGLLT